MRKNEGIYYKYNHFQSKDKPLRICLDRIKSRATKLIFEFHNFYTTDYFYFNYKENKYFGRKMLSKLHLDGKQKSKKCSQITAPMLIGLVLREKITEKGVIIFYKPLENGEKVYIFDEIKVDIKTDIYFPYPYLSKGREVTQPAHVWEPTIHQVQNLDAGEEFIRKYTIEFLAKHDLSNKKIFDPACSTGKFLNIIKETYPEVYTIGQDLHPGMIQYAQENRKIDRLIEGDSINSPIPENSVDFIFFRFLNSGVVTSEQANMLFSKIANKCKDGGYLIVLGHTPVLLSMEWFQILGLQVEQSIAYSKEEDSIFQYYVVKKIRPVPTYEYEGFCVFNFSEKMKALGDAVKVNGKQVVLENIGEAPNRQRQLSSKL